MTYSGRKRAVVFNDTRAERHYGCDLVMSELMRNLDKRNIEVIATYPVGTDWRKAGNLPRRGEVDLVVVNGEGSIHHPESRPRAVYLSELGGFARESLGAPAFLINSSISDINGTIASSLKAFEKIYVREPDSAATLSGYGINSEVVPDLTVTAEFPSTTAPAATSICATDSVIPAYSQKIQALCERNSWPCRSMHWKRKWWEKFCGISERRRSAGVADFVSFLGSHRLVITGRFHTVTMCVGMQIPFLAIESNTHKISSFASYTFGNTRRVVSADALDNINMPAFATYTPEEQASLSSRLTEFRQSRDAMFDAIAKVV